MTTQTRDADMVGYKPPTVLVNSGPPRAVYLAPVYEWHGKKRLVVGERLTSSENPLSADPRDERRYLRKGYRIASPADIKRLSQLDGRLRLFAEPLDDLVVASLPADAQRLLENRIKELEQQLAVKDADAQAYERSKAEAGAKAKLRYGTGDAHGTPAQ